MYTISSNQYSQYKIRTDCFGSNYDTCIFLINPLTTFDCNYVDNSGIETQTQIEYYLHQAVDYLLVTSLIDFDVFGDNYLIGIDRI